MGRRPWTNRLTTEECICLSVVDMHRAGVFRSGPGSRWVLKPSSGESSGIGYTVVEMPGYALGLRFNSEREGPYIVPITTTSRQLRYRRFWIKCPAVIDGIRCGRRVGRLYLPPGQHVFGCRTCYYLTYRSAQQHDSRRDALLRNPEALVLALQSSNRSQRMVGIRACARLLGRLPSQATTRD